MGDDIYLIGQDGAVVEMSAAVYDSEDILQRLLVDYPAVLAGAQIDRNNPRRWLLVDREVGIPAEEGGANRWAVDHVFLDQDGVPTLVEVKRSSDTRIRREVVGQMLDYAASAFACLPIETIRAAVEDRYGEEELAHFLEPDPDLDTFWTQVKTNLTAGRLRLLFVADVVPPELRRVVEFLNAQMDPAEVLAVEITQYAGANLRTLVPRVIGRSEQASRRKAAVASPTIRWDEGRFFADLGDKAGAEAVAVARRLLAWTRSVSGRVPGSLNVVWGRGAQLGFRHRRERAGSQP